MLGQENLDSLMIINVERDITVSVSKIIQRFAKSSKHMANYLFKVIGRPILVQLY